MRMHRGILWTLVFALLLLAGGAAADGLQVTTEPGSFRFDFTLPGEKHAMVQFSTADESGWFTVSSEDGHFTGTAQVLCTYGADTLVVKTMRTDTRGVDRVRVAYPGTPKPDGAPAEFGSKLEPVRDLELAPAEGGIAYDFTAQGSGSVWLKYRTAQQTGKVLLYPREGYHYAGTLLLPYTFNQSNVYVTLISGKQNKKLCQEKTTTRGYTLTARETESAPEGRLKGVVVCIDAGHSNVRGTGGPEPLGPGLTKKIAPKSGMAEGTYTRRRESVVMLEIAYVVRDELRRQGATVVMTREREDQWLSNIGRDDVANEAGAHVMLRLHGDNVAKKSSRGFGIFYPMNSDYALAVADKDTYHGYAQLIIDGLNAHAAYGRISRPRLVPTDDYVGNNWAKMPCFLIELGFMSNVQDDILLSTPAHQQDLAEGLAEGVWLLMVERGVVEP